MPPCMNCLLIEMGEMACYQERCQECGRIPPGRKVLPDKKSKPPDVFKKLVGRKLAAKKSVTPNGDLEAYIRTNPSEHHVNTFSSEHNFTKHERKYNLNGGPEYSRRQLQEDSMV